MSRDFLMCPMYSMKVISTGVPSKAVLSHARDS